VLGNILGDFFHAIIWSPWSAANFCFAFLSPLQLFCLFRHLKVSGRNQTCHGGKLFR
jgi:hypothetical protein